MATIQATNVSNLGIAVDIQPLGYATAFKVNPLLGVVAHLGIVKAGAAANRYVSLASFTAAAVSENAAITGSALPTLDADNGTLASGGVSYEMTSEAYNTVQDIARLLEMLDVRAQEAISDYVASDSSVGIAALIASLNAYGTSGAALTFNTIRLAKAAVCNVVGWMETIFVGDGKGVGDLQRSLESSGGTQWANQALSPVIEAMFVGGAIPDAIGYTGIKYDGVSVFQTNLSSQLYATGGDTYGILTVPPPLMGGEIAPAVVCDFRDKPSIVRSLLANKVDHLEFMGKVPITRWYGEPNTSNADAVRISYKATFDSFLHNAAAAAAPRWLT